MLTNKNIINGTIEKRNVRSSSVSYSSDQICYAYFILLSLFILRTVIACVLIVFVINALSLKQQFQVYYFKFDFCFIQVYKFSSSLTRKQIHVRSFKSQSHNLSYEQTRLVK